MAENDEINDIAYEDTEERIKRLERRIKREYKQAGEIAEKKFLDFMARFEKKDDEMRRQMQYGLINEDEYNEWRRKQILQADHYAQLVDTIAGDYSQSMQQARLMIAEEAPDIYATNYNFATWQAEEYGRIDTSFSLYNRDAVAELAMHDARLLPLPSPKRLEELKAKDLLWNRQLVSSSFMQSILVGDSVPHMAKRLMQTVGEKDYATSVRAARTMATAVQNKARTDAFVRAKNNGSRIQTQIWLAVRDQRTRHAHRQLDHQEVPVGEKFTVDGYELAYPGDPSAPGYLIYNCRCGVRARIAGLEMIAEKTIDNSKIDGMSYEEWKAAKPVYKKSGKVKK